MAHGILSLYTPLFARQAQAPLARVGGSWLNLAESIQRILKRRALSGQHPQTPEEIMGWFLAVGHIGTGTRW